MSTDNILDFSHQVIEYLTRRHFRQKSSTLLWSTGQLWPIFAVPNNAKAICTWHQRGQLCAKFHWVLTIIKKMIMGLQNTIWLMLLFRTNPTVFLLSLVAQRVVMKVWSRSRFYAFWNAPSPKSYHAWSKWSEQKGQVGNIAPISEICAMLCCS